MKPRLREAGRPQRLVKCLLATMSSICPARSSMEGWQYSRVQDQGDQILGLTPIGAIDSYLVIFQAEAEAWPHLMEPGDLPKAVYESLGICRRRLMCRLGGRYQSGLGTGSGHLRIHAARTSVPDLRSRWPTDPARSLSNCTEMFMSPRMLLYLAMDLGVAVRSRPICLSRM